VAELALKIGAGANYEDGDVLCAFNRRRIRWTHAQHVCWPRIDGRKVGGQLGESQPLLQQMLERTAQYRFTRVARSEVLRVEIATEAEATITPQAKDSKLRMDVVEYVARRLRAGQKPLFGSAGAEVWYGGRTTCDTDTVEAVWDDIEHATPLRRTDHDYWPISEESEPTEIVLSLSDSVRWHLIGLGRTPPFELQYFGADRQYHVAPEGTRVTAILGGEEARVHLFVHVDEFSDARAEELVEPLGRIVDDEFVREKKRKHNVTWRDVLGLSAKDISDVLDTRVHCDYRERPAKIVDSIVTAKTLQGGL